MIKTLRITSIMAAILAVVFLVFPAVFGVRSDEQVEEFLGSAGVIEKFSKARGEKSTKSESQVSPLVKQATAFALYLNPPPAPRPKRTVKESRKPRVTPKPRTVSAKFTLVGTSYYASHPELSLALIDEPGKDLRWARQSSEVGHLIIEQIKDGLVVVRDGQRTFELVAERPEKRSILKSPPSGESGPKATLPASGKTGPKAKRVLTSLDKRGARITRGSPAARISDEKETFDELVNKLKALQQGGESGRSDSERSDEENEALMEKLISELKAMRISAKEAERLDHLGKELKDVERDTDRSGPNSPAKK